MFGSLARDEPADDVDLAVDPGERSVVDLWDDIVDALGTDRIDVVDLRDTPPVQRYWIVREGRPLFSESDDAEREFELGAVREYRDTHHHRAIQDAYLADRSAG